KTAKFINDFIETRHFQHGGNAELQDRYAIISDPGLAPLVGEHKRQAGDEVINEDLARRLCDMPGGNKPATFEPQVQPGANAMYVFWRSEDREAKTVPFDQIRAQVLAAWKLGKARDLAKTQAEKMAVESRGFDAQKLRDEAAKSATHTLIELPE